MPESSCVILTTAPSSEEANRLAEMLVTRRLAACVQITGVSSYYVWNGELKRDPEQLLLIKTVADRYDEVEAAIRELHSYEIPEIVQLSVEQGLPAYLHWVSENTR